MLTRDLSLAGHGHDFDLLLPSQGFTASLQVLEVEIPVAEPYVVGSIREYLHLRAWFVFCNNVAQKGVQVVASNVPDHERLLALSTSLAFEEHGHS